MDGKYKIKQVINRNNGTYTHSSTHIVITKVF